MTAEIKAVARRHLETDGANLSLRAVSRDMGMASSALYRYFANRDDLLTALILDAYNALGEAVEAADAAVTDRSRLRVRWLAAARAVRRWALAKPAEYALIYGTPVPGYAAPPETIAAFARTPLVLVRILSDGHAAGAVPSAGLGPAAQEALAARLTDAVRADLTRAGDDIAPGFPTALVLVVVTGWIQLFGVISFELFGKFNNMINARTEFFDQQMEFMADLAGLPPTR
jgi:AcrR family transcriptional regulator